MDKKADYFSLNSRTIKQKLVIAFQLMSILPLLVCVYLVSNYIFPKFGIKVDVIAFIIISAFVAIIGLLVIKEVFDRLTSVTTEAKYIAAGDIHRTLEVSQDDEVGELGNVLNNLTQRIRTNMDELKQYSEKTSEINIEIQKKVIVLSNLMQISTLISSGAKFEEILKTAVEKFRFLANSDTAFLLIWDEEKGVFFMKIVDGVQNAQNERLKGIVVEPKEDIYNKALNLNKLLILDKNNFLAENLTVVFLEKFQLKNCLAMPVFLKGKVKAVLGIGNGKEGFGYGKDDIELLAIFSKQVAIAIENDIMANRIDKLEIKDALTGLYNQSFITGRLKEEIRRAIAYQRPCAFIIFNIDNFKTYREKFGLIVAEAALKKIAVLVRDSITDIDRVGRTGDDEFSVILPEKNKRQAQESAEDIRKKIAFVFSEEQDKDKLLTFSAGVSENPLDGVDAEQLVKKARELLAKAKAQGKNRVVVF
ncbi:MAG: diguanylate cyclase [Candidatus Omnitrophica bacterium]|nr:diguanylate cyclase [Candidatus Omnitrophota bacterium]